MGGTGHIFCDEAGFTGNNLLDSAQEVFTFASVAMEHEQAKETVERTLRNFKLQGAELKGARLLKSNAGRRAITSVIKDCAAHTRLVSDLKKFALACKFFEYIFEPALADQNSIFYGTGFHLFIANLLFALLRTKNVPAEAIFEQFSKFMREGDDSALESLFPRGGLIVNVESDPLAAISVFAMVNRRAIQEELESIRGDGSTPNWVLDLTTTSLFGTLSYWGEVYDDLDVWCDKSKPLETETDFLKVMVGRRDHIRLQMFGKERQYTFNLVDLPKLVDSRDQPGIQIADVFASALARAMQQRYWGKMEVDEKEWLRLSHGCFLDDNIWPDLDQVDLRRRSGFVNCAILHELTERCIKKQDLFRGMPEFIAAAHRIFPRFSREQRRT
jgi:hypothetical protein